MEIYACLAFLFSMDLHCLNQISEGMLITISLVAICISFGQIAVE